MADSKPAHQRYLDKPFVGSSHTWARAILRTLPTSTRMLDIGSGSGAIGSFLKAHGFQDLFAVEPDVESASHTSEIYQRIERSIEAYSGETFDLILLLDVLEHLTEPEAALNFALSLLKPGGRVVISVPNIAHWSIRLSLLFGFFSYSSRGILDRTHLRFFTRKSFLQLLRSVQNTRIERLSASISPAEFVLPSFIWDNQLWRTFSQLRITLANFWPGLMAYQHLAVITKEH